MGDLKQWVDDIHRELSARSDKGRVADYIPQLAKVPAGKLGIAVATIDGETVTAGDADESFSIQSISKLFTLTLALRRLGGKLWTRVDREPSGNAFNSIVQLEHEQGRPRNPFVNAGAIAVTDVILDEHSPKDAPEEILRFVRYLANDDDIHIDDAVAKSEAAHGDRNMALAHFIKSYGVIHHEPTDVLGVYFQQCAIAMTCRQLAHSGLFLARQGVHPRGGWVGRSRRRENRRGTVDHRPRHRPRSLRGGGGEREGVGG